jgi:hypothetical protein
LQLSTNSNETRPFLCRKLYKHVADLKINTLAKLRFESFARYHVVDFSLTNKDDSDIHWFVFAVPNWQAVVGVRSKYSCLCTLPNCKTRNYKKNYWCHADNPLYLVDMSNISGNVSVYRICSALIPNITGYPNDTDGFLAHWMVVSLRRGQNLCLWPFKTMFYP